MLQSELLDFLPVFDRHRLSRLCMDVESEGLIERFPNPENRRENVLKITPKGAKTISEFKALIVKANPQLFDGLSTDQVNQTFENLQQILDNLDRHNENPL